jgi:hypothetical protein
MADTTNAPVTYTEPHYVAASQNGWGIEMIGTEAVDGSDLDHAGIIGLNMTDFKIECEGIRKARVRNRRGKWLPYKKNFVSLGDGTDITGIELVGEGFIFSVHCKGGSWLASKNTSNVEGEVLGGLGSPIDAVWIEKI